MRRGYNFSPVGADKGTVHLQKNEDVYMEIGKWEKRSPDGHLIDGLLRPLGQCPSKHMFSGFDQPCICSVLLCKSFCGIIVSAVYHFRTRRPKQFHVHDILVFWFCI